MAKKKNKNKKSETIGRLNGNKNNFKFLTPKINLDLHPETKHSIWAIILFTAALIVVLSYIGKAGAFGEFFYNISQWALGRGIFLIPVILVMSGLFFLRSIERNFYFSNFLGSSLLLFSSLGILNMVFKNNAGGYLGRFFSYPFNYFFGYTASLIILFSLVIISFLIMLNISLKFFHKKKVENFDKNTIMGKTGEKLDFENSGENSSSDKIIPDLVDDFKKSVSESVVELKDKIAKQPKSVEKTKEYLDLSYANKINSNNYKFPPSNLLEDDRGMPSSGDIKANANVIKRTLENFGIDVDMGEVNVGPTVTQYTLKPAEGIKLSRITALNNDLALALAARSIRIEAPIPGKSLVGIEVPNKAISVVGLKNIITSENFQRAKSFLSFCLGRDVTGNSLVPDLGKMPHLLVAGATGAGKSVTIQSLILSLLYRNSPETLKFIFIDPKRVELTVYNNIPHLLAPVIVDGKKAVGALRWAVKEMEKRYEVLSGYHARDIISYNSQMLEMKNKGDDADIMPYIVVVIDELADLMAAYGKDVEALIVRLAQMARAVGIHLVVSTQRPSVEVITGLIKANITSRVALQVASQIDSRTIIDMTGAEKLLGNGDMLFLSGDTSKPKRIQGTFVSENEVKKVVDFLKKENIDYDGGGQEIFEPSVGLDPNVLLEESDSEDELYEEAKRVVIEMKKASASLLQRRLRVGYARAARLLDILEDRGIIGPGDGAKPREVYISSEE